MIDAAERLRAWGAWCRCGKPIGPSPIKSCLERPYRVSGGRSHVWDAIPVRDVPATDDEAEETDKAICALPKHHQRLLIWRYHWQLEIHKIATRLKCSTRTVDRRIVDAHSAFVEHLTRR